MYPSGRRSRLVIREPASTAATSGAVLGLGDRLDRPRVGGTGALRYCSGVGRARILSPAATAAVLRSRRIRTGVRRARASPGVATSAAGTGANLLDLTDIRKLRDDPGIRMRLFDSSPE